MIINASENRIYSVDLLKIVTPPPPPGPPPPLPLPSQDQFESGGEGKSPDGEEEKPQGEEIPRESGEEAVSGLEEKPPNEDNEISEKQEGSIPAPSPPPVEIPVPHLYSHLMYLNLSTNYLFSLYGVQCCPHLKVL
jgi:hypothetical protein